MKVITLALGPLHTNCYILYNQNKKAVVIDPAFFADRIKDVLETKKLTLDKILLTHAHFDHVMATEDLRENGAEVYLHIEDEEMLYDPELNYSLEYLGRTPFFSKVEHLLKDGDVIDFDGEEIKVMHTPGHTKGSVCYLIDKYLFSGDTLFYGSVGRTDLYGGDYDTLMCSLKKLKALEEDYIVLSGHGGQTTLEKEKNDNIYMKTLR